MFGFYWSTEYEDLIQIDANQCSRLAALAAESYSLFDSASDLFNNACASPSWTDYCQRVKQLCELRRYEAYARMFLKEYKRFSNPFGKGLCLANYVLKRIDSLSSSQLCDIASDVSRMKNKMTQVLKIVRVMSVDWQPVSLAEIVLVDEPLEEPHECYEPTVHPDPLLLAFVPQQVGMNDGFEVGFG